MEFIQNKKKIFSLNNLGKRSFYIGIFFLPSALPISAILIVISLIISFIKTGNSYLRSKWNYPILLSFGLMTFSCIRNTFDSNLNENLNREISSIWIDLFNWIPMFLLFYGCQYYLKSDLQRKLFSKILLISSLPVLASCIGQYWLNWEGPLYTLNGLIVWFMRPISKTGSLTGLFSNTNYLGCWLSVLLPFAAIYLNKKRDKFTKFSLIGLNLFLIYLLLLTSSRNSLVSLFITISFLKVKIIFFILLCILFLLLILNNLLPSFFLNFGEFFLPINLIKRFGYETNLKIFESIRFEIWGKSLSLISQNPLWGLGAASFPFLYLISSGLYGAQHSHNLALHLAINYGIPLSIILVSMVSIIIFKAYKIIYHNKKQNSNSINKAWFVSSLIIIIWQLSDITYFDGKISILSWVLLGGLCSIISNYDSTNDHESNL